MKSFRLVLGGLAVALAAIVLTLPSPTLANSDTTLAPGSVTQVAGYGVTSGSLANLASADHATFVDLTTPGTKAYKADFTFTLPGSLYRNTMQSIQVKANYKGQLKKQQTWTWLLYNWRTKKWIKLGLNTTVTDATAWTDLSFDAPGTVPMDYVDPITRHINVRIQSNNSKYDAQLDYLAVVVSAADAVAAPSIGGCTIFPITNVWNARVDKLPVEKNSTKYIATLGKTTRLHPDFGTEWAGENIGIPFNEANSGNSTPKSLTFLYNDESDAGPYPILDSGLQVEAPSDSHMLTVYTTGGCHLYELYAYEADGPLTAGSGAIWDLTSNTMRTDGFTSADAAGLPILPGLVRYDEVASGHINHAIRFTARHIRDAYIWPASHSAGCPTSSTSTSIAPMGQRFRLKASYVIPSNFTQEAKVVLTALKEYGMILADCGSDLYISGEHNDNWLDVNLDDLKTVPATMFEAVDESSLKLQDNSYAVAP